MIASTFPIWSRSIRMTQAQPILDLGSLPAKCVRTGQTPALRRFPPCSTTPFKIMDFHPSELAPMPLEATAEQTRQRLPGEPLERSPTSALVCTSEFPIWHDSSYVSKFSTGRRGPGLCRPAGSPGLVVGHEFTKKLESDCRVLFSGTAFAQPTLDVCARYKLHLPFILLMMLGRGVEPAQNNQPYFVGYFGVQILLPLKSYDRE